MVAERLRFPQAVADLVARTARARRLSKSDVYRLLVDQGIQKSREDWSGRG